MAFSLLCRKLKSQLDNASGKAIGEDFRQGLAYQLKKYFGGRTGNDTVYHLSSFPCVEKVLACTKATILDPHFKLKVVTFRFTFKVESVNIYIYAKRACYSLGAQQLAV